MPEPARESILNRLRASRSGLPSSPAAEPAPPAKTFPAGERLPHLRRCMEGVKTEFLEAAPGDWPAVLHAFLSREGIRTLAYGPASKNGRALAAAWPSGRGPALVPYDRPFEEMKAELFDGIDAGFTSTRGGIAETGSLIVWPSPEEPRLLSLVPPMHVALLDAGNVHDTLLSAMQGESWAAGMPANALLISGPSKTADIEQTLAYGVHGPKRLVVLVIAEG